MASTALKTDDEKREFFDPPDVLAQKVDKFVSLLLSSSHFIAFTGAGISTSAGVADFRSGINTVLPTGPGLWEKKAFLQNNLKAKPEVFEERKAVPLPNVAKNKIASPIVSLINEYKDLDKNAPKLPEKRSPSKSKENDKPKGDPLKPKIKVNMHEAFPTSTHMSFVELAKKGMLKFLVSQNVDGLHRRSGFPVEKLSELHGNTNLEKCKKCGKGYMRDFRCRTASNVHDHKTTRKCDDPDCRGELLDSIINFGENLPEKELNDSFDEAEKADLCLAMGSSLRVTPAANIPERVGVKWTKSGKAKDGKNEIGGLVIVNIQKTPLDNLASLRIYAFCDVFMEMVMDRLKIKIPKFILNRRVIIELPGNNKKQIKDSKEAIPIKKKQSILIRGVDADGSPYSLFKKVEIERENEKLITLDKEPFKFDWDLKGKAKVWMEFQGNYKEGRYGIEVEGEKIAGGGRMFVLNYDAEGRQWLGCEDKEI